MRYVPNYGSLTPILRGDDMREVLVAEGEKISQRARSLAPVRSGGFRDSIQVVADLHPTRWAAHVGTQVAYGGIVESRTHVLRRSLG